MDIQKMFNLPSYTKGKNFAEATEMINSKIRDKATREEMLKRVQLAQEHVKSKSQPEQYDTPQQGNLQSNQSAFGGFANATSMLEQSQKFQLQTPSVNQLGINAGQQRVASTMPGAQVSSPSIGGVGGAISGAVGGVTDMIDTFSGKNAINESTNDEEVDINVGRGALGAAAKGASMGSALGPIGTGVGALVGGIAGLFGGNKAKKEAEKKASGLIRDRTQSGANNLNLSAKGGFIDINKYSGKESYSSFLTDPPTKGGDWSKWNTGDNYDASKEYPNTKPAVADVGMDLTKSINFSNGSTVEEEQVVKNKNKGKFGNIVNEGLRAAPIISNALQLKNLKKPEHESLNRLNTKFKPGYVDEAAAQNVVQNQFNSTVDAIKGATGGSQAATRANILGAQINKTKSLSAAQASGVSENRKQDAIGQQFNLGVDKINLQQSNVENDINAKNKGVYETNKSALKSSIGTDIGSIGKERRNAKVLGKMFGYDKYGNKIGGKNSTKPGMSGKNTFGVDDKTLSPVDFKPKYNTAGKGVEDSDEENPPKSDNINPPNKYTKGDTNPPKSLAANKDSINVKLPSDIFMKGIGLNAKDLKPKLDTFGSTIPNKLKPGKNTSSGIPPKYKTRAEEIKYNNSKEGIRANRIKRLEDYRINNPKGRHTYAYIQELKKLKSKK